MLINLVRSLILLTFCYPLFAAEVSFKAVASLGIHIDGECKATAVVDKAETKAVGTVDLASCDSHNDKRNVHMKEDLGVKEFPVGKMEVLLGVAAFTGKLELHGQTRDVQGTREGNTLKFVIKLSDFGITRRTFMGMSVKDEVSIIARY